MADVARESGVSLSTVSIVFSDKPGLPSETRLRVLNAARRLGYNPRRTTTFNQMGLLRTVGLVMRTRSDEIPRSDHFYSHVVAGIESACRQNNLNLLYATMCVDPDLRPVELPGLIENGGADGLLLLGVRVDEMLCQMLDQCALPVVLVDSYQDRDEHTYDQILSDNEQGAYQATQYLIEKGHRKLGFIGGSANTSYPSFDSRRKGFARALRDYQIEEAIFVDCRSDRDEAIAAARELLSQHPELTALVGVNDFIAITAMHVVVERGRRVGGDLAIIGFDDILLSESVIPPLTTMQVDKIAMGRLAVCMLMNRSEQPNSARATLTLHPRLIERNSVMAVPASIALSVAGLPVVD